MAKDISRLRREEVEKERKRILGIKLEQKKTQETTTPETKPEMEQIRTSLVPEPETPHFSAPRPPSGKQKIIVRIIIGFILIFVLVNAGLFIYWYFIREEVPRESPEQTVPVQSSQEEESSQLPEQPFEIIDHLLDFGSEIPTEPRSIDTIVIHSSFVPAGDAPLDVEEVIDRFRSYGVASHYLISQEGTVYRLVKDENIAYHAGESTMPDGRTDANLFSIGIELIYLDTASPTNDQYQALAHLIKELDTEYSIPSANILGHQDISPTLKTDPWNFNWDFLHSLLE